MEAPQRLRLSQKRDDESDCRLYQTAAFEVQMRQMLVVLYEVLEAGHDFEVEWGEFDLSFSCRFLRLCQFNGLIFEQVIVR